MQRKIINIDDIELPNDYLTYDDSTKRYVCHKIILIMIDSLREEFKDEFDLVDTLIEVLTNSQQINIRKEDYEMAALCRDLIRIIREHTEEGEE